MYGEAKVKLFNNMFRNRASSRKKAVEAAECEPVILPKVDRGLIKYACTVCNKCPFYKVAQNMRIHFKNNLKSNEKFDEARESTVRNLVGRSEPSNPGAANTPLRG